MPHSSDNTRTATEVKSGDREGDDVDAGSGPDQAPVTTPGSGVETGSIGGHSDGFDYDWLIIGAETTLRHG